MTDQCEHGIDYDAECATCESEIAEAKAAGALTPHEIGLYWKRAEATRAQVVEAEFHVQQLRDARDRAERSAERIEARAVELAAERDAALARIARAERLIDSWERDAPEHSNPVFIGRLRECLRRDPAPVRLRSEDRCVVCSRLAPLHDGLCCFHKYDEQPLCIHCASDEDPACDHQWLDRPESDTRECLNHAQKRSSMPLSMHGFGSRAVVALRRFAERQPAAGVLLERRAA